VYKPAFTHEHSVELIAEGRGKHFDPDVTDAFMEIREEFRTIAKRFADADADIARQADRLVEA
jgi:putative two-component system response regulator